MSERYQTMYRYEDDGMEVSLRLECVLPPGEQRDISGLEEYLTDLTSVASFAVARALTSRTLKRPAVTKSAT